VHNLWGWEVSITALGWRGAVWDAAGGFEHRVSCKKVNSLHCDHN